VFHRKGFRPVFANGSHENGITTTQRKIKVGIPPSFELLGGNAYILLSVDTVRHEIQVHTVPFL
jgi:hypothetical protein